MLSYEESASLVWEELDSKSRGREWAFTREAKAPLLRVHNYFFKINQFWWEDLEGKQIHDQLFWDHRSRTGRHKMTKAERDDYFFAIEQINPPWDSREKHLNRRYHKSVFNVGGTWSAGPSGVKWERRGLVHDPSTWDYMEIAANMDIEWLEKELERFQAGLSDPTCKNKIFSFTGVGDSVFYDVDIDDEEQVGES